MNVELRELVIAEVIPDKQLQMKPRWGLRGLSLKVGPYFSGDEHEDHVLQTVGSGNWYKSEYDEIRFGKDDRELKSLWFHIPEENLLSQQQVAIWMAKRPTVGLLRLESSGGFNIEPTTFRWFDHSSRQLICINEAATSEPCDRLRLQITRDVDLLFANGKLCGWILSHSVNYLVNAWEAPYKNEPNDDLANLLHEYLELISDPNIERMEDEDPNILQKLLDLRTRAGHSQSSQQQRILYSSIEGILDLFYDKAL